MKSEKLAIKKLTGIQSGVSIHYFIKQNGEIILMVPDLYVAWHAGISKWKNDKLLNKSSIGIEISNPGHQYGYESFKVISDFYKNQSDLFSMVAFSLENTLSEFIDWKIQRGFFQVRDLF